MTIDPFEQHPNWTRENEDQITAWLRLTHRLDYHSLPASQQAYYWVLWVEAHTE